MVTVEIVDFNVNREGADVGVAVELLLLVAMYVLIVIAIIIPTI